MTDSLGHAICSADPKTILLDHCVQHPRSRLLPRTSLLHLWPRCGWREIYGICRVCLFNLDKMHSVSPSHRGALVPDPLSDGGVLIRTQPIDHRRQTETSSRAVVELLLKRRRGRKRPDEWHGITANRQTLEPMCKCKPCPQEDARVGMFHWYILCFPHYHILLRCVVFLYKYRPRLDLK